MLLIIGEDPIMFFKNKIDLVSKTRINLKKLKKNEISLNWIREYDSKTDVSYNYGLKNTDTLIIMKTDWEKEKSVLSINGIIVNDLKLKSFFKSDIILGQNPSIYLYGRKYYFEDCVHGCNGKACEDFYIVVPKKVILPKKTHNFVWYWKKIK